MLSVCRVSTDQQRVTQHITVATSNSEAGCQDHQIQFVRRDHRQTGTGLRNCTPRSPPSPMTMVRPALPQQVHVSHIIHCHLGEKEMPVDSPGRNSLQHARLSKNLREGGRGPGRGTERNGVERRYREGDPQRHRHPARSPI